MTHTKTPLLRSARFPALLLLVAAALGLIVANSPLADSLMGLRDTHLGIPALGVDLSIAHWISDGLLAVFFFTAAIELRHELTVGALRDKRKALVPAIAAAGGVLVPVLVYLLFTFGTEESVGWPVPTATDIAFALGVLAVFGRGLPAGVRAFLLALAILDDIVGIVFIAVLFTNDVRILQLVVALILVAVFAVLSRFPVRNPSLHWVRTACLIIVGVAAWVAVLQSGVHATIAGVVLGLAMAPRPADHARHILEPWINGLVLPIFAFSAAAVTLPSLGSELKPAFWGVLIALPVGKIIGISLAGWGAQVALRTRPAERLPLGDLLAAGALGGIGFTVSLLLGELAFGRTLVGAEVTVAVLAGSVISMLISAVLVSLRARSYQRRARAASRSRTSEERSTERRSVDG